MTERSADLIRKLGDYGRVKHCRDSAMGPLRCSRGPHSDVWPISCSTLDDMCCEPAGRHRSLRSGQWHSNLHRRHDLPGVVGFGLSYLLVFTVRRRQSTLDQLLCLARVPRSQIATHPFEPSCSGTCGAPAGVRASRIDDSGRDPTQQSQCATRACSKLQRGGAALVNRRSVLSRLDDDLLCERATGNGEGRGGRDVSFCAACLPACTTPHLKALRWFASKPIQVLRKTVTRRLVFGLRLLLPFSSSPFVWPPGIHAHDSYPCAAQEHSHEANGSNRREVPCPRLRRPSPGHLYVRGRVVKSGVRYSLLHRVWDTLDARSAASAVRHSGPSC